MLRPAALPDSRTGPRPRGRATALSPGALVDGVDPAELVAAVALPAGWTEEDAPHLASGHYRALADFLRTAARYRQAVLVWTE